MQIFCRAIGFKPLVDFIGKSGMQRHVLGLRAAYVTLWFDSQCPVAHSLSLEFQTAENLIIQRITAMPTAPRTAAGLLNYLTDLVLNW
jgi:hypothetical protein